MISNMEDCLNMVKVFMNGLKLQDILLPEGRLPAHETHVIHGAVQCNVCRVQAGLAHPIALTSQVECEM
jgi:hypothetical protein